MFTGIISQSITVRSIQELDLTESKKAPTTGSTASSTSGLRIVFDRPASPSSNDGVDWALGDSIALNGICSTIAELSDETCTVEYMLETCQRTTVRHWQIGDSVHVEAPVTLQTKFSGSVVLGHVDTVGTVTASKTIGADCALHVEFPEEYQSYVIPQGGITLDGVNLTIVEAHSNSCVVKLVPYTKTHTHLANVKTGQRLNIEFDYFAKIVIQASRHLSPSSLPEPGPELRLP